MKRINVLTGCRYIAALIVVMDHLGGKEIAAVKPVVNLAPYMMSYFFVLSGFVLALTYHRPGKPFDLKHFWVSRISRIFPIYLFSLFLVCIHLADTLGSIKTGDYLSAVFLAQAWIPENALIFNFPLWALSPELFFFLLFPLISHLAARQPLRRMIWISLGVWAVTQIIRFTLASGGFDVHPNFISYSPLVHMDSFIIGIVCGLWFMSENRTEEVNPSANLAIMIGSLSVIVIQATFKIVPHVGNINTLFSPIVAAIVLTLAMDRSRVSRALGHRWLVTLGEASYSLYVLHVPVYWLISDILRAFGVSLPLDVQFIFYLPFLTVLSLLAFRYIENPVQGWLRAAPQRLPQVAMDLAILAFAIWLSFVARVGLPLDSFQDSAQFATRIGTPLLFILLILFGWYSSSHPLRTLRSAISLTAPLLLGFFMLGALMLFALSSGWIPSYPRSFTVIAFLLSLGLFYFSRLLFRRVIQH